MHYIKKTLSDSAGSFNSCWIAGRGIFALGPDEASITLAGWADADAKRAGMNAGANLEIFLPPSLIGSLPLLIADVAAVLIAPGGLFEGGALVDGCIELALPDKRGRIVSHWVGSEGIFNLLSGEGALAVKGWLDRQAKDHGKDAADVRTARIMLTELPHFAAVSSEAAQALTTTPGSPLFGGELQEL